MSLLITLVKCESKMLLGSLVILDGILSGPIAFFRFIISLII